MFSLVIFAIYFGNWEIKFLFLLLFARMAQTACIFCCDSVAQEPMWTSFSAFTVHAASLIILTVMCTTLGILFNCSK